MASFSVVTNVSALNAETNLVNTNNSLNNALEQLSSGLRINNSGDDAAGLVVANQYRSDEAVLNQGIQNAGNGLSTLQIQDGALSNISTLLDRLSTLATESASASAGVNRTVLNSEFKSVLSEIDREANVAGMTSSQGFSVFISDNGTNGVVGGTIGAADTTSLGINSLDISTAGGAATAVSTIATAVGTLGDTQATVGALENRLTYAISLAQNQVTNESTAESRIRDANIADESTMMTQYSILTQSGMAALAQANNQAAAVLKLLQ